MRLLLGFVLTLLFVVPAWGQGVGVFGTDSAGARAACTDITSPVTGKTWCLDSTIRTLRVYNGTSYISDAASSFGMVNVKDYGATGDGVTDDRVAIASAVAACPLTRCLLYFPTGTYLVTSANPIVNANSDFTGLTIMGAGVGATILSQAGAGNGIVIGNTACNTCRILGLSIVGNDVGGKGIVATACRDCVIQDFNISGFLDHAVQFSGASTLNSTVSRGRITAGVGSLTAGRGVSAVGNSVTVDHVYFNIGNNTNRYGAALDVRACAGCSSLFNMYDGTPLAIQADSPFVSLGDWFDISSGGVAQLTYALDAFANNPMSVIQPATAVTSAHINFASGMTQPETYFTMLGTTTSMVPGSVTVGGHVILTGIVLASLGTPANGTIAYCSNCRNAGDAGFTAGACTSAAPATGNLAKRLNGAWICS